MRCRKEESSCSIRGDICLFRKKTFWVPEKKKKKREVKERGERQRPVKCTSLEEAGECSKRNVYVLRGRDASHESGRECRVRLSERVGPAGHSKWGHQCWDVTGGGGHERCNASSTAQRERGEGEVSLGRFRGLSQRFSWVKDKTSTARREVLLWEERREERGEREEASQRRGECSRGRESREALWERERQEAHEEERIIIIICLVHILNHVLSFIIISSWYPYYYHRESPRGEKESSMLIKKRVPGGVQERRKRCKSARGPCLSDIIYNYDMRKIWIFIIIICLYMFIHIIYFIIPKQRGGERKRFMPLFFFFFFFF